jgi:hypothetical protein
MLFDAHIIRLQLNICRLKLSHRLSQVDVEELSEDRVAFLTFLEAKTLIAISS